MVEITLTDIQFTKGETVINHEPNTKWEDDIIKTSSQISYTLDGYECSTFVNAETEKEAIQEIIPQICFNQTWEEDLTFKELGLENPTCKSYDEPEWSDIETIDQFMMLENADVIFNPAFATVKKQVTEKAMEKYEVVVK